MERYESQEPRDETASRPVRQLSLAAEWRSAGAIGGGLHRRVLSTPTKVALHVVKSRQKRSHELVNWKRTPCVSRSYRPYLTSAIKWIPLAYSLNVSKNRNDV